MAHAICICPEFVGQNINDALIFSSFFIGTISNSADLILLDSDDRLKLAYLKQVEHESSLYEMYKAWEVTLESAQHGKVLYTNSPTSSNNIKDVVFDVVVRAATTFNKVIVIHNNNEYQNYVQELIRQRIHLLNASNLTMLRRDIMKISSITLQEFDYDLAWVIHRLGRRHIKGLSEDDYNDYLRDMLLAKNYEIKDQTREGESQSGLQAGELDLIVEDNGVLFAIIEALILTSVDRGNIVKHYKKLLKNYNPMQVKRIFLVTYYEGTRFDEWNNRYLQLLNEITTAELSLEGYAILDTKEIQTPLMGLKKIEQHFMYGGEQFACIHYAVKLS